MNFAVIVVPSSSRNVPGSSKRSRLGDRGAGGCRAATHDPRCAARLAPPRSEGALHWRLRTRASPARGWHSDRDRWRRRCEGLVDSCGIRAERGRRSRSALSRDGRHGREYAALNGASQQAYVRARRAPMARARGGSRRDTRSRRPVEMPVLNARNGRSAYSSRRSRTGRRSRS